MREFLLFVRRMVRDRAMLTLAVMFACLSAGLTGAGFLTLVPIIRMIVDVDDGQSLPELARSFNEQGRSFMGIDALPIHIPEGIVSTLPEDRFEGVVIVAIAIVIMTFIGAAANFLHQYLSITVATRAIARARREAYSVAIGLPLSVVTQRGASEFVARIVRDTTELQRGLIALMSKSIAHLTQGIAVFIVALMVGRSLTLFALITLPVLMIIVRKLGKRIRRGTRGALKGQEELLRLATETVQGLRSVKASTGEQQVVEQFDAMNQEVVRQELRARVARAFASPLVETLGIIVVGALACIAAKQILEGSMDVGSFVVAIGGLAFAGSKFKMIANLIAEMQAASAPAVRIMDVLDEPPEVVRTDSLPDLPPHTTSIVFDHVSMTYPGKTDRAVDDVSLEIPFGARVAFVGPNGSGKTTLLSLLPRLFVPEAGRLFIDGIDLSTVSLKSLRTQIAVVTQETTLFRGTIAENIAFGRADASRAAVEDAARRAYADSFIRDMPGAYDASVAEQGASLSGGQRQRLAIARAILRDPRVLILDEATSQVDSESEAHIHAALNEFSRGRTVLMIAHRLSTVLDADRIVVLDRGRIVATGRHDELLDSCDLYRRLCQSQLIGSRADPAGHVR